MRGSSTKGLSTKRVSGSSSDAVTRFHKAVNYGDTFNVFYQASMGAPINAKDADGFTPLHIAVRQRNNNMVCTLLTLNGLNVNVKDNDKKTPICYVLDDKSEVAQEIADMLRKRGAVDQTQYFEAHQPNSEDPWEVDGESERRGVVDSKFLRKLIITFSIPFVFIVFINGTVFALKFFAVALLFYFVVSGYFVSEIAICPPWYNHQFGATELTLKDCPEYWEGMLHNPMYNLGIPYEDVSFRAEDGYTLKGWYVPCRRPESQGGVSKMGLVLVHGGGRDRRAWMRHLPMFMKHGFSCLLFDFREHGISQGTGRGFTYGMKERFDVVAACKYMREELGYKYIATVGTSVGGSSVIMAAYLDSNIDVVVAENPVLTAALLQDSYIRSIIGSCFTHNTLSDIIFAIFRFMCSNWLNVRLGNKPSHHCQARHVVGKVAPRPLLLMHGTYDDVVPYAHSVQLYEIAKEPKELWLCPQADHCCLYNKAPEQYEQRLFGFLEKHDPSSEALSDQQGKTATSQRGENSQVEDSEKSLNRVDNEVISGINKNTDESNPVLRLMGKVLATDLCDSNILQHKDKKND